MRKVKKEKKKSQGSRWLPNRAYAGWEAEDADRPRAQPRPVAPPVARVGANDNRRARAPLTHIARLYPAACAPETGRRRRLSGSPRRSPVSATLSDVYLLASFFFSSSSCPAPAGQESESRGANWDSRA